MYENNQFPTTTTFPNDKHLSWGNPYKYRTNQLIIMIILAFIFSISHKWSARAKLFIILYTQNAFEENLAEKNSKRKICDIT